MNERTRQVLERVAEGVWCQHDGGFFAYHQCAFCCVSPEFEHDSDCPTALARQELDNGS